MSYNQIKFTFVSYIMMLVLITIFKFKTKSLHATLVLTLFVKQKSNTYLRIFMTFQLTKRFLLLGVYSIQDNAELFDQ